MFSIAIVTAALQNHYLRQLGVGARGEVHPWRRRDKVGTRLVARPPGASGSLAWRLARQACSRRSDSGANGGSSASSSRRSRSDKSSVCGRWASSNRRVSSAGAGVVKSNGDSIALHSAGVLAQVPRHKVVVVVVFNVPTSVAATIRHPAQWSVSCRWHGGSGSSAVGV